MRSPIERVNDMLEAIVGIERYTSGGRSVFDHNELIQVYVVHYLQILGEASLRLPESVRSVHPEVPWSEMGGMRHILVHGYFEVDLDAVWAVVEKDLPPLKHALLTIRDELQNT